MSIGYPLRHLRECDSTNRVARDLAAQEAPHGTVVTTSLQTGGRGRQGRAWLTPRPDASLAYSTIIRTGAGAVGRLSPLLPLTTAVAVCEAVERLAPVSTAAKWPNDVWIKGRKCAGILIEARPQDGWAVIGVGLNLSLATDDFPIELRERVTSVGHGVELHEAREELSRSLSGWLARTDPEVIAAFDRRDALKGLEIGWNGGTGVARGVDGSGNLVVENENGHQTLAAGEVHLAPLTPPAVGS